jgi:integrase
MASKYTPSTVITANGITKPLTAWATDLSCPVQTIIGRLDRGWTVERAVSERAGNKGGNNRGQKLAAEVLTPEELQAILAANNKGLTGDRNKALIVVGWRSGLRISEALALKLSDLNAQQQTLRVLHGKGNKARTVGLDSAAWAIVQQWIARRETSGLPASAPLFCTETGGKLQDRYVRELLPRLAKTAKIDKRCHFHGLRHTMAFELASEGVPMHLIQQQLGHSNLAVTSRYISHLNPAETISRMKGRTWGSGSNKATTVVHSHLPSPDWLDRLRADLGERLISFTDLRSDADQFRALVTLI